MPSTATKQPVIQRRCFKAGEEAMGGRAGDDVWSRHTIGSRGPIAALNEALGNDIDGKGKLKPKKRVYLRTGDPDAKKLISNFPGAEVVERVVRLGKESNAANSASLTLDQLNQQLDRIERDLRAGRAVKVKIDCIEIAERAGEPLSKLLRNTKYNGRAGGRELLKLFASGTADVKEIMNAIGPNLQVKNKETETNLAPQTESFAKRCWHTVSEFFAARIQPATSLWTDDIRAHVRELMKRDTPYEKRLRAAIFTKLESAGERLLLKKEAAATQEVKPLIIKVQTIEHFVMSCEKLSDMKLEFGNLLILELTEPVKAYLKEQEANETIARAQADRRSVAARSASPGRTTSTASAADIDGTLRDIERRTRDSATVSSTVSEPVQRWRGI